MTNMCNQNELRWKPLNLIVFLEMRYVFTIGYIVGFGVVVYDGLRGKWDNLRKNTSLLKKSSCPKRLPNVFHCVTRGVRMLLTLKWISFQRQQQLLRLQSKFPVNSLVNIVNSAEPAFINKLQFLSVKL